MTGRVIAAALLLAFTSPATASERDLVLLREWITAVDSHAAGDTDQALSVVTAWTYPELERMRPYIEALVAAPPDRSGARQRRRGRVGNDGSRVRDLSRSLEERGDFDLFRKRATILHTDAAMLGSMPLVVTPPTTLERRYTEQAGREVQVKSFDGQVTHFELRNLHWVLAMDVLDSLPAKPSRDPIVGQWYRAVGAYFARERRFADALSHFDRGRNLVGGDPGVLYGEACLQETLGAPRIQDYVRVTTLPHGLVILGISSPQTHFRRAEALLRKALAADPTLAEASLRLGRVLTRLEQYDESLTHLRAAVTSASDPAMTYYAHLFSGDALHALNRLAEARAAYEQAIAVFPDSQAARLALGAVLRAMGDRPAALAAIDETLRRPARGPDDDPWWEYYDGDASQVDRLLAALREPFSKPR